MGGAALSGLPIATERMVLREWTDADFAPLHALCTCPQVMATIGPLHDEDRTRELLRRLQERQAEDGCTVWAMERKSDGRVLGFCGITRGTVPFLADELEIGWRMAADCWGQSYAREAAEASLEWAAAHRPGRPIWAITAVTNHRSRGLMERLNMAYRPEFDFAHPRIAADSPLSPHVTYRLDAA
jgi:RimJ/RimL family protein N-acetyltransferase